VFPNLDFFHGFPVLAYPMDVAASPAKYTPGPYANN